MESNDWLIVGPTAADKLDIAVGDERVVAEVLILTDVLASSGGKGCQDDSEIELSQQSFLVMGLRSPAFDFLET